MKNFIEIDSEGFRTYIRDCIEKEAESHSRERAEIQKDLLTRKDVADLFQICLTTVHNWVRRRTLLPVKIGRKSYFRREDLLSLIDVKSQEGRKYE